MKKLLTIVLMLMCLAAAKREYVVTCPDCKTICKLKCLREEATGGYAVPNGVFQQYTLYFKCPRKHKFTSCIERFVEKQPQAVEVK